MVLLIQGKDGVISYVGSVMNTDEKDAKPSDLSLPVVGNVSDVIIAQSLVAPFGVTSVHPIGSCLFAAGKPANVVGIQNFQTFSTRQSPHLGD